jgi:MAP3K TRAFs-binding domain
LEAAGFLGQAIEAYLAGFEADWRDCYPGINALSLIEMADESDPRHEEILPVVRYAAQRRARASRADYWDYATLLELAVLARDDKAALRALADVLVRAEGSFATSTTADNLRDIRLRREERGEASLAIANIEAALRAKSAVLAKAKPS